jgi:multidrug efflux pump subunit AcrA (membrane-fusion protein)
VTARLNAYPDWRLPGHVIAVIPTADRSKGTVTVRIALDQKDPRVLPEMGVRVAFLGETADAGGGEKAAASATLPSAAVQSSGSDGIVFVVHDSTVERRAVRLGAANGDRIAVLAGLSPGERVAIGDFSRLRDGAQIHIEP